jgi:amidase/aspartyl-tRNA(Asn)/glutamyl-tRNA(Gln) amidotransferase subunit A
MKPTVNKKNTIQQTAIDHDSAIFCQHGPKDLIICDSGTLVGQRLAVKDLFALKGEKNSAGNPDWFTQASEATSNAFSVERLLQQGCRFVGFTHTDEIAYSLEGNNIHFGAAENPKLRGHACGGSSMGSAAAVAANLADIGLGTDTGGSIRVPASYCGLFGFRPSHGAVNSEGLIPLAPDFDTTGWFTQSAELLEKVGEQLLPHKEIASSCALAEQELVVCDELFDLVQPELATVLILELTRITPLFKKVTRFKLEDKSILTKLADTFRILQGREIARTHGQWV